MEPSRWIRDLIFYGSLSLNIVLAVLLFLRTAINEVVRDWWKDRRQKRREVQDRLHELHGHLSSYPGYHFSHVLRIFIAERIQTDAELEEHMAALQHLRSRMEPILDFIRTNELRFSPEIQKGLSELRQVGDIGPVLADRSRIGERYRLVVDTCDRLKAQIEMELRRL